VPGRLHLRVLVAGQPAFAARTHPDGAEAITLTHRAGGTQCGRTPICDIGEPAVVLDTERLRGLGLDRAEASYVTHDREQTELLAARRSRARPAHHRLVGRPWPRAQLLLAL
jgi:hypothetical protein